MALVFWTKATQREINKTFGAALKTFKLGIPAHKFVAYKEDGDIPEPGPNDVVVASGFGPMQRLRANGLVPKNRTVTSLREKPIKRPGGGAYLITHGPEEISSFPDRAALINWDTRLAHRFMTTGDLAPPRGNYQWVNDLQPLIDYVEAKFEKTGQPVFVSTDTETEGFSAFEPDKEIVSVSFTAIPGKALMLYTGRQDHPVKLPDNDSLHRQLIWLFTTPKIKMRLANGKYDMIWLKEKWDIDCTNFNFDSLLVGSLLQENQSNSLNLQTKIYTDMGGYDDYFDAHYDKDKMGEITNFEDLGNYAGGDTDAEQQVADVLLSNLRQDGELTNFYCTVIHPAARAFEKVERTGVCIDREKYEALRVEVKGVIKEETAKAMDLLPWKIRHKYMDRFADQIAQEKSPLLPSVLKDYFFGPDGLKLKPKMTTEKTGAPSMAKSHLRMFGDVPSAAAMVKVLTGLDRASKVHSTYVDGFLKCVAGDGKFHPSYMLFHGAFNDDVDDESGTVSGRLAARWPAIQTLPKKSLKGEINWAKKLRACYVSPTGKVILQLDYSQGELRVVACVAPEPTMIAAYEKGLDLHAVTGASLLNVELALFMSYKNNTDKALAALFDDARDRAKPANFGLLYGMSAEGFMRFAWASYGRKFTLAEAEAIREAFFKLYPGLLDYHTRMKNLAYKFKQVRSPMGRIRHLEHIDSNDREVVSKARRQAINSPVQAALTDMMIWAIALLYDAYRNDEFQVFAVIHDAVYAYVDADKVALRAQQAKEVMQNLPFDQVGWEPILNFPADAMYGENLAELVPA